LRFLLCYFSTAKTADFQSLGWPDLKQKQTKKRGRKLHSYRQRNCVRSILIVFLLLWQITSASACYAETKADAGDDIVATAGDEIQFDGGRSSGSITRYRWEFGDHEYFDKAATFFESNLEALKPGEGPRPTHTYWKPGRYEVTLKVFDSRGNTDTDTMIVTVEPNKPPVARLRASIDEKRKSSVKLDASGALDPEDDPISYSWNFSDGSGSNEKVIQHKYDLNRIKSNVGDCNVEYRVILRATDSHKANSMASTWVSLYTDPKVKAAKTSAHPALKSDMRFAVSIRGAKLKVRTRPDTIRIFAGERAFLPVEVTNDDTVTRMVALSGASPRNTYAELEEREVPPGKTIRLALEIQTLNVYNHKLTLQLNAGESPQNFSVPVEVSIKPFTPLLGGYAHFSRHAAPDVIGQRQHGSKKYVHISLGEETAIADMQRMKEYPIQIYRANCQWHNVQRDGAQSYEWELSDWEVDQAVKAGSRVVLTFATGPPKWVGRYDFTNDKRALDAYRQFVEKMVDRYGDKVDYYELSNEPFLFWLRKFMGQKQLKAFKNDPSTAKKELGKFATVMTDAAKAAHEIISRKDPTALLIMPGFENKTRKKWDKPFYFNIWDTMFKKGIQRYCQRVGVHNFPFWYNGKVPDLRDHSKWEKLDQNADSSELLAVMRKHNVAPAIWLTEIGGFRNSDATEVNHAMAMLHTTAIIAHQYGEGILTVGLYDYPTDDSPYVYLVKHENHHKTLGFYAFKQLISALSGAVPYESEKIKNSDIIGADYGSVVVKPFSRGSEDILCVWNNSSATRKVTLDLARDFSKTDLYEITETSFSVSGEFYAQRKYSRIIDSDKTISVPLRPLDFKIIQVVTPKPEFRWLAKLDY
jgi:hypothetical protein